MRTLIERERLAYIEGRTEEAQYLGEAIGNETERVLELMHEIRWLEEEVRTLEAHLAEAEDGC